MKITKNVLLTGANGFVGQRILKEYPYFIPSPSLRNVTEEEVKRIIEEAGVEVIIHTAAISSIPECEKDPEASYYANILIPVFLAKAAAGRKLICFSSDQVYTACNEDGPYTENMAKPANTYAKHKLEMENKVLDIKPDSVMLRAEWMYDSNPQRMDYFHIIANAEKEVYFSKNEYRGVTYLKEVAETIPDVINLPGGSYNFGSETDRSIYDITKEFAEYLGKRIKINDRPADHNLWMNCEKARRYGVSFSSVSDGLRKCSDDSKKN